MGAIKGNKELANHYWERKSKSAVVVLENKDTLKVSIGGCAHHYTKIAYISRQPIPADSIDYWLYKTNWIMQTIFDKAYQQKFLSSTLNDDFVTLKGSNKNHFHLDFPESKEITNEYFYGIDIEMFQNYSKMKIEWYMN